MWGITSPRALISVVDRAVVPAHGTEGRGGPEPGLATARQAWGAAGSTTARER
jgi:hypothetical protein